MLGGLEGLIRKLLSHLASCIPNDDKSPIDAW